MSSLAQAHGLRSDVRVDLAPVEVEGLVVELHQDLFSPQLAISNRSGKRLEILDPEGRSFLRIGPEIAEADLAAEAFHYSRVAGGGDVHANTLSKQPRWRTVAKEPAYGWFDTRIATTALDIPYALRQLQREQVFGEWRIPARLDGKPFELKGLFTYTPPPDGMAMPVLLGPAMLAPGVTVQILPGPVPAIFLRNGGAETVSVLDAQGKAFLRVGRDGVWADVGSAAWRVASSAQAGDQRGWQRLSTANSTSWLESRAAWRGTLPQAMPASGQLNQWTVPLQLGERRLELRGVIRWIARQRSAKPGG